MMCVLSVRLFSLVILWERREHKSFLSHLSRPLHRSVFVFRGCLSVCMCELEVKRGIDKTYALNVLDMEQLAILLGQ